MSTIKPYAAKVRVRESLYGSIAKKAERENNIIAIEANNTSIKRSTEPRPISSAKSIGRRDTRINNPAIIVPSEIRMSRGVIWVNLSFRPDSFDEKNSPFADFLHSMLSHVKIFYLIVRISNFSLY